MSLLNAKKFLTTYTRQQEIREELDNGEARGYDLENLLKEFKKTGKRMTTLLSKISEEEYTEILEDTLCSDYENAKWSIDLEY